MIAAIIATVNPHQMHQIGVAIVLLGVAIVATCVPWSAVLAFLKRTL